VFWISDALYGGFEDLETGVVFNGKKGNDGQSDDSDDGFDEGGEDESGDDDEEREDEEAKAIAAEKAGKMFNSSAFNLFHFWGF